MPKITEDVAIGLRLEGHVEINVDCSGLIWLESFRKDEKADEVFHIALEEFLKEIEGK